MLSSFDHEPIRWIERYGRRPLDEGERLALFHFWREAGRRMNIRDIPRDYTAFERYNEDYERNRFRFSESNRRVGAAPAKCS